MRCSRLFCFLAVIFWCGLALRLSAAEPESAVETIDFERQVAPIFAQHCDGCHGAQLQESNFRLDVREIALGTADFGQPPIVPGDSQSSPLIRYVSGTDPDGIVMPPDGEGTRLPAAQVQILRAWIDQGAPWPDELAGHDRPRLTTDHWSFQPVRRPAVPLRDDSWVANPIDAFVLQALRQNGLTPSPRADRRTLIRRLYLDMLGLPPTPAEIKQFEQDQAADAYPRLVARVLDSHHYGERWAQHWLDVVGYGESDGFETNHERPTAYHYRDYVIRSLNEDKPYDQFICEQLAGDALGADAATGFLVAGPHDIVKSPDINLTLMQRQDELAGMINTTGTAFLGMTVGCARCHNHKFDPILQSDYYSLQAVFAGVQFGSRVLRTPQTEAIQAEIVALQQEVETLQAELAVLKQSAVAAAAPAPQSTEALRPPVHPAGNVESFAPRAARFVRFTIQRTNSGEPCLDELQVFGPSPDNASDEINLALASRGAVASASGTLQGYPIHKLKHVNDGRHGNDYSWISDTPGRGWVQIELPREHLIHRIEWGRDARQQYTDRLAIEYTIEVATEPDQWSVVASSADRQPYGTAPEDADAFLDRLPTAQAEAARRLQTEIQQLIEQINTKKASLPQAYAGHFVQPGPTYRLYRGDPMAKREEVPPDALTVLGSLGLASDTAEQQRRLALAHWIARADNPLTARVIVNRVWHYHFGRGIVSTPSDFGANGSPPSHPQLLDWLASEFVERGWSLKKLHRLILLSSTYQQSSQPRPDARQIDADCRLLWRYPPRRLEAETIRDSILYVAGTLNLQRGGPGFNIFEVQKETVHHYFPKETFGPEEWRRMIYMTKIRQERDAVFGAFDCPDGGQVIPQRTRSTTPLQALNLLNSRFILQQSKHFAQRLRREAGEQPIAQVHRAFQLLYGRPASEEELADAVTLIEEFGLPAFCRALLNTNEFLFISQSIPHGRPAELPKRPAGALPA